MKFATDQDAKMFLLEIEKFAELDGATKELKPDDEMIELFISKRKTLIPGLKDFRRRQNTKQQWRHERYKMLRGIKRFHKSTSGKKFHRALGRYLATREALQTESSKVFYLTEIADILKALSSLKTHAFIELEFYHPLSEELEYRLLFEELLPIIDTTEKKLLQGDFTIESSDEETLLRIVDFDQVTQQLADAAGVDVVTVDQMYEKILKTKEITDLSEENDTYHCISFARLKDEVNKLKQKN
jgi:hypothetical protein